MKISIYLTLLILLNISCSSNEKWVIKEIKFKNNQCVYLKSYTWGLPDKNMTIISNHPEKKYDEKTDYDFGSYLCLNYELENDSLKIILPETDREFIPQNLKFNNTKFKFYDVSSFITFSENNILKFGKCN